MILIMQVRPRGARPERARLQPHVTHARAPQDDAGTCMSQCGILQSFVLDFCRESSLNLSWCRRTSPRTLLCKEGCRGKRHWSISERFGGCRDEQNDAATGSSGLAGSIDRSVCRVRCRLRAGSLSRDRFQLGATGVAGGGAASVLRATDDADRVRPAEATEAGRSRLLFDHRRQRQPYRASQGCTGKARWRPGRGESCRSAAGHTVP